MSTTTPEGMVPVVRRLVSRPEWLALEGFTRGAQGKATPYIFSMVVKIDSAF